MKKLKMKKIMLQRREVKRLMQRGWVKENAGHPSPQERWQVEDVHGL